MSDDTSSPRRIPLDVAIVTPKVRNRLAAERMESLRVAIDEAMKVLPKREVADMLGAHQLRVLRS